MMGCLHNPPRCQIGQSFVLGRDCRLCWLYAHDPAYRKAWGGGEVVAVKPAVKPEPHVGLAARPTSNPRDKDWSCTYLGRRVRDERGAIKTEPG